MNIPKLSPLPYPVGTFICSIADITYLPAEKAIELTNSEDLILFKNDKESNFSLHYVGEPENYIATVENFRQLYMKVGMVTIGLD